MSTAVYDLAFIQPDGTQVLFDIAGGMAITGLYKLGLRVLLELMTEQGSINYLPARGTRFLTDLRYSHASELDIITAFYAATLDLQRNLTGEDAPTDPPNEMYQNAIIGNIVVTSEAVSIAIQVTSMDGGTILVQLPLLVFQA